MNVGAEAVAALVVLAAPAALSFLRRGDAGAWGKRAFFENAGRNGLVATTFGAIAGNVGIGSFLAIFLFTNVAPILGFSIVGAYTIGLLFCAAFARSIRHAGELHGARGLIDLIVLAHGTVPRWAVWGPVAIVFVLRSAVQIGALGVIAATVIGGGQAAMILLAAAMITAYLILGGYRAAVQTDILQASIVMVGGAVCAWGLSALPPPKTVTGGFGEFGPALLLGIWLFLPWSALLAVDNWQRVTLARSTRTAQVSYLLAAIICGALFTLMAVAGHRAGEGASMYATFAAVPPQGLAWVATAMFVACIMSSIDTFIMPLVSALGPRTPIWRGQMMIAALMAMTAAVALTFGDALETIIAAFNSLTVFLPAAAGALYLKRRSPSAPVWSMNLGLLASATMTMVDRNLAALVGFAVALAIYWVLHRRGA
ncbi:MAG: hypothetical protein ACU0DW_07965 [Shimia sp.]